MKKLLSALLALSLILSFSPNVFAKVTMLHLVTIHDTETELYYSIDDERVADGYNRPIILGEETETTWADERILLPIRELASVLGYSVEWDDETKTVIITNALDVVRIPVYENAAYLNGESCSMNVLPVLRDGVTYVNMFVLNNLFPNFYFKYTTSTREFDLGCEYQYEYTGEEELPDDLPDDIRELFEQVMKRELEKDAAK